MAGNGCSHPPPWETAARVEVQHHTMYCTRRSLLARHRLVYLHTGKTTKTRTTMAGTQQEQGWRAIKHAGSMTVIMEGKESMPRTWAKQLTVKVVLTKRKVVRNLPKTNNGPSWACVPARRGQTLPPGRTLRQDCGFFLCSAAAASRPWTPCM